MSRLRWQIVLVVVALVAIAILLLGQQPILGDIVASPAEGGIYIEGLVGDINRLNPLLDYANTADQDIDSLIFSSLIDFDDRGNPQLDLAENWDTSVNGEVYNFKLREDIFWHDGEQLTTADIVFTLTLLRQPELPIPEDVRALWDSVQVFAFDEFNIQFRLPQAYAPFIDYLAFGVLPAHVLEGVAPAELVNNEFNLNPVGSGPYRFGELLVENGEVAGVVLNANDEHHLGRPFIDQVVFRFYETSAQAYAAYQQGDVLGISRVDPDVLAQVLADPTLNVYSARMPKLSLVLLNLDNNSVPFFKELEVRRALIHGTNRQWIIDQYLSGQAFVANSPILPGTWAYNSELVDIPYDPDTAISELRGAGYTIPSEGGGVRSKDGLNLSFELVHPDSELHTLIAQSIRENWSALGVQVNLVAVPYDVLVSDYLEPRAYQAALVDLNLSNSPDPDPYPFWHQAEATGGQNYSKWNDRRASEYLEAARVTANQAQRQRLYRNFQIHFNRELPSIPLYFSIYNYAVSAQVQGVSVGPIFSTSDRFYTLPEWFLVAGGAPQDEAAE